MAFARRLAEIGVEPGDRVAISLRNLPEWPVAFYGAVLAGAVATPLNAWWTGGELAFALEDCGATAAVFDGERLERIADRLADLPTLRRIFTCRRGEVNAPASGEDLEETLGLSKDWAALPPGGAAPALRLPEQLATLFYTSGTTGAPKGAPASHRAATTAILSTLFSQARAFVRRGETPPTPSPEDAQRALRGLDSILPRDRLLRPAERRLGCRHEARADAALRSGAGHEPGGA